MSTEKHDDAVTHEPDHTNEDPRDRFLTGPSWAGLSLAVLSCTFLYALDNTIVANIRPPIIQELGQIEKLPWISVAYALGETSCNPIWGTLFRKYDNKILFCVAVAIFEVGSAVCGAAPSTDAFIIGRVIAGTGGSGIYIGTLNIFSALTLVTERALYLNYVGVAWCLGTILGPIIGGALADSSATWRWAFYINLCIAALTAPFYLWFLPGNPSKINTRSGRPDLTGALLFVGLVVCIITAISFGGSVYDWSNGRIIALLVLFVALVTSFALQQGYCALTNENDRIFPVQFCKNLEMCLLFAETSIGISLLVIPIYFIPLFFQFVRDQTALQSGVRMLPFICAGVAGCMLNGSLFARFSRFQLWFAIGASLSLIGGGLLTTISLTISDARIYGFSVIIGLGSGLFAQAGYAVGMARQPQTLQPHVTAFLSCAQMGGLALSISTGTSIFVNKAEQGIGQIATNWNHTTIQSFIAGTGSDLVQKLSPEQKMSVLEVVASALRDVFIMASCVAGLGVLLSLLLKKDRLFS